LETGMKITTDYHHLGLLPPAVLRSPNQPKSTGCAGASALIQSAYDDLRKNSVPATVPKASVRPPDFCLPGQSENLLQCGGRFGGAQWVCVPDRTGREEGTSASRVDNGSSLWISASIRNRRIDSKPVRYTSF
jgi:hypothetical protein